MNHRAVKATPPKTKHGRIVKSTSSKPKKESAPPRAWQRMLSGRRLDLLDPSPFDIEISDIAHGLAFQARWNGQTKGEYPYSVAAHSLLVEDIFTHHHPHISPKWRLAALLHDAPEYVIGDMISPVKATLGDGYGSLEARLTEAVHIRFGLPAILPSEMKRAIKTADLDAAYIEAKHLAGFDKKELDLYFKAPKSKRIAAIAPQIFPPDKVRKAFLARFFAIEAEIQENN